MALDLILRDVRLPDAKPDQPATDIGVKDGRIVAVTPDLQGDAVEEMQGPGTPLVASVSHEVQTYGPRLIQLGLALVRGQHVAPYHHVNHKVVRAETLAATVAHGAA